LQAGREVKVPGFGKVYLSRVKWSDHDKGQFGTVNTVRFKPFGALKEAVGKRSVDGTLGEAAGSGSPLRVGGIPGWPGAKPAQPRPEPQPSPEPEETPDPSPEPEPPGDPKPEPKGSGSLAPVVQIHTSR